MEMEAVAARGSVDSSLEALAAGADLLIFSHDLERAVAASDAIEAAVGTGRLTLERLQEAYRRAIRLRDNAARPLPLDAFPPHRGIGREIARRAVTLVRGVPHANPVATVAVSFGSDGRTLEREAPAMEELTASLDPSAEEIQTLIARLDAHRRRPMVLARRAHLHPKQVDAIMQILDRYPDALVVSLREPFDLPLFPAARHLLAAYGDDLASIGGLADVVFGGSMPTGRLPVSV
jgi:beta-N-acetylhexosaminidase